MFRSSLFIKLMLLLQLAICSTVFAGTSTCNPNVSITSTSISSTLISVTVKNNGSDSVTAQVLTYKQYAAGDVASTPSDNSGVATLASGQSATISTSIFSCASVIKLKINNSCESVIHESQGSGYCEKCTTGCSKATPTPTPTCTGTHTPAPTPTPTATPTPVLPVCDAGGPYSNLPCSETPVSVQLDGSKSSHPNGDTLYYTWTTDCPSSSISDASVAKPTLSLITAPASSTSPSVSCKVNLSVKCATGPAVSCSSDVTSQSCVRDCAGVINGSATVDRCGVCNGDGNSCLGCNSVNIQGTQLALDNNANELRDNVLKVNKQYEIASKNAGLSKSERESINTYIAKSNLQAQSLYKDVWAATYTSFPPVVVSCTAAFCVNVSTAESKVNISEGNEDLVDLAKASEKKIKSLERKAKKNKNANVKKVSSSSSKARVIVNQSISLNNESNAALGTIPGSQSSCN